MTARKGSGEAESPQKHLETQSKLTLCSSSENKMTDCDHLARCTKPHNAGTHHSGPSGFGEAPNERRLSRF
jgi:hypothetical protein